MMNETFIIFCNLTPINCHTLALLSTLSYTISLFCRCSFFFLKIGTRCTRPWKCEFPKGKSVKIEVLDVNRLYTQMPINSSFTSHYPQFMVVPQIWNRQQNSTSSNVSLMLFPLVDKKGEDTGNGRALNPIILYSSSHRISAGRWAWPVGWSW